MIITFKENLFFIQNGNSGFYLDAFFGQFRIQELLLINVLFMMTGVN